MTINAAMAIAIATAAGVNESCSPSEVALVNILRTSSYIDCVGSRNSSESLSNPVENNISRQAFLRIDDNNQERSPWKLNIILIDDDWSPFPQILLNVRFMGIHSLQKFNLSNQ